MMASQIGVTVRQVSKSASEGRARRHACLIDRPEAKGGSDRGPMGGELMLLGMGGCFMSNLLAAVQESGLDVSNLSVAVTATLEEAPPRFADIVLLVNASGPDRLALQDLIARAEARCISVNTAKAATKVTVRLA